MEDNWRILDRIYIQPGHVNLFKMILLGTFTSLQVFSDMPFGKSKVSSDYKPSSSSKGGPFTGKLSSKGEEEPRVTFGKDKGSKSVTRKIFADSDDEADEPVLPSRSKKTPISKDEDSDAEDFTQEIGKVSKKGDNDNLSKILGSHTEANNKMIEVMKSIISSNTKLQETLEALPKHLKEVKLIESETFDAISKGMSATIKGQERTFDSFGACMDELAEKNNKALSRREDLLLGILKTLTERIEAMSISSDDTSNIEKAIKGIDSAMDEDEEEIVILAGKKISSIDRGVDTFKRFRSVSDYLHGNEGDRLTHTTPGDN